MLKAKQFTARQLHLIRVIERRSRDGIPAVQRDLAEELGIRRDSLNKLLARTRRVLQERGIELQMPARSRPSALRVASLCELLI
jgi:hypothetical protein